MLLYYQNDFKNGSLFAKVFKYILLEEIRFIKAII